MLRLTRSNGSRGSALPGGTVAQPANKKTAAIAAVMDPVLMRPFYIFFMGRRCATRAVRASIRALHRGAHGIAAAVPRSDWVRRGRTPAAGWRAADPHC